MRIGIDVSSVIYDTGVSWYTRNLIQSLLSIDSKNDYLLFGGSLRRKNELDLFLKSLAKNNVEGRFINLPPTVLSLLWNNLHKVNVETFTGRLDVFHSSDWTQPPTKAYKVTTIHDLVPIRFPELSHPKIVAAHKKRLDWIKKEADKIIAVSGATKKEIIDLLGIEESRIVVIPEAGNNLVRSKKSEIDIVKNKYDLDRYLLVVGADPRKNITNITEAFKRVQKDDKSLKLVIVGRLWGEPPDTSGVVTTGHVSQSVLTSLYSGAEALVYASNYEGFGLPILDAMEVGCPVVTSNISSMPEVAGKAAELVDPKDIDSISTGVLKVLKNRKRYIEFGYKQAEKFSWEETARKTLEVYKGAK